MKIGSPVKVSKYEGFHRSEYEGTVTRLSTDPPLLTRVLNEETGAEAWEKTKNVSEVEGEKTPIPETLAEPTEGAG